MCWDGAQSTEDFMNTCQGLGRIRFQVRPGFHCSEEALEVCYCWVKCCMGVEERLPELEEALRFAKIRECFEEPLYSEHIGGSSKDSSERVSYIVE